MKLMFVSDFMQVKGFLPSTGLVCLFVMLLMTVSMGTPIAGAAAMAAMLPYMLVYSVLANDEAAGWAKLRETLPLSRRDVVFGRYAFSFIVSIAGCVLAVVLALAVGSVAGAAGIGGGLVDTGFPLGEAAATAIAGAGGAVVALAILAVVLPIVMRLGITRTARILPLVFVLVFCAGISFAPFGDLGSLPDRSALLAIGIGAVVVVLALYAASVFVSCKLYESREF